MSRKEDKKYFCTLDIVKGKLRSEIFGEHSLSC